MRNERNTGLSSPVPQYSTKKVAATRDCPGRPVRRLSAGKFPSIQEQLHDDLPCSGRIAFVDSSAAPRACPSHSQAPGSGRLGRSGERNTTREPNNVAAKIAGSSSNTPWLACVAMGQSQVRCCLYVGILAWDSRGKASGFFHVSFFFHCIEAHLPGIVASHQNAETRQLRTWWVFPGIVTSTYLPNPILQ